MEVIGQLQAPTALPPGKEPPGTRLIGGWMGLRAGLDTVSKRTISSPRRHSNPGQPIVQTVVSHYTA